MARTVNTHHAHLCLPLLNQFQKQLKSALAAYRLTVLWLFVCWLDSVLVNKHLYQDELCPSHHYKCECESREHIESISLKQQFGLKDKKRLNFSDQKSRSHSSHYRFWQTSTWTSTWRDKIGGQGHCDLMSVLFLWFQYHRNALKEFNLEWTDQGCNSLFVITQWIVQQR